MSDEDILYELKDLYQWRLDRESQEVNILIKFPYHHSDN